MNAFQKCTNTSDAVPLYLPQQLYLKPAARLTITVQLGLKMMGKTITHYEVMERLRELIRPDEFEVLKVTKTTLELIRFEAEVDMKNKVQRVVSKLDNKSIKLKDFNSLIRVKSAEFKGDFPSKHDWDSFFRDAKDMNEMKQGERPDTVHIANMPTKWFVPSNLMDKPDLLPSEKMIFRCFEKFGSIRNVDVPVCDPYRSKMKAHITGIQTSSFDDTEFFEGYIQYKDYIGFCKCMDALRGMKLMRKSEGESLAINIYVDFDKSKHLTEGSIRRRDILRDRLVLKQKEKENKEKKAEEEKMKIEMADRQKEIDKRTEKERRRREREEKRKAKIMSQLKVNDTDEISDKIAKEERKLIKVQRRLEAIRLVEELFKRIKVKLDKEENFVPARKLKKNDELNRMKEVSEYEVKTQKEKLHSAIKGRVILKSIISGQTKHDDSNSSSESSLISEENDDIQKMKEAYPPHLNDWYSYMQNAIPNYGPMPPFYNPAPRGFPYYFPRGRGYPGPSGRPFIKRPYNNRGRGSRGMNHYVNQEHYKYAQRIMHEHQNQHRHSYSRSRSRSRSHSRSRSYSHRRSRTRSRSRSRSRSPSRRHTRSRSKSHRRSRSTRRSRSESTRRTRTPPPRSRTRSRSKSRHRR